MMALKNAAAIHASTAEDPSCRAIMEGRPKIPLPIMEFTIRAAMLHRPMLRTSDGARNGGAAESMASL